MFPTNGVILTNAGIDLVGRALSDSIPIIFTTAKIGTGDLDNMEQAKNLKDLKQTYKVIGITSISRNNSGLVKIRASYTNKDFMQSVQIKEIGIFAKVSGVSEVLMGYVNDGIGELVPPGNTGNIVERIRDLYIGITEDAKVTAIIDESIIYATIYDLEEGLKKKSDVGHTHQNATITINGFMSFNDKGKLDGIESGANKYIHPDTATIRHVSDTEKTTWNGKEPAIAKKTGFNLDKTDSTEDNTNKLFTAKGAKSLFDTLTTSINTVATNLSNHILKIASTTENGHMSKEDKAKLNTIATSANNYIHPDTAAVRHVNDTEKANWNSKEPAITKKTGFNLDKTDTTEDNTNKLFTAKGALTLFNSLTSSINTHIAKKVSPTEDGHMIASDKAKLNGIAAGANNYIHPDTAAVRHVSDTEKGVWNGKEPAIAKKTGFNLDKTDTTENNVNKLFTAKGALDLFNLLTSELAKKLDKAGGDITGAIRSYGANSKISSKGTASSYSVASRNNSGFHVGDGYGNPLTVVQGTSNYIKGYQIETVTAGAGYVTRSNIGHLRSGAADFGKTLIYFEGDNAGQMAKYWQFNHTTGALELQGGTASVVTGSSNGVTGYRIHADGYKEAWGTVTLVADENNRTITLPFSFATMNYNISSNTAATAFGHDNVINIWRGSVNTIGYRNNFVGTNGTGTGYWRVGGY